MSFNEASEDTGFHCFCFFSLLPFVAILAVSFYLILSCVPLHLLYEGKCQNKVASGDEEASGDKEASGHD